MAATNALLEAQTGLSSGLVGPWHWKLIMDAEQLGGVSAVPGAGGEGGSVVSIFQDEKSMKEFAAQTGERMPGIRLFRASFPGI